MAADSASTPLPALSEAFASLVARAAPAIVSLGTGQGRSSGFVWRPGLIVTAEEALPDKVSSPVTLPDGDTVEAKLVGRDPSTDVALLRIERTDLPAIPLESGLPVVGSLAVAVGAAEGSPTATFGIVSRATGKWRSLRGGEIDARILLDMRIPRSSEGGLVFDANGNAIGMAVFGPHRRVLAIPLTTVDRVAVRLQSDGRIPRGYLGLGLYPVVVEGSNQWGAMIMNVDPAGPGGGAGLRQGDMIVSWNGEPIRHVRSLLRALGPDSIGQTVSLGLRRGGEPSEAAIVIAERPAA